MREILTDARRVANYIVEHDVEFVPNNCKPRYNHIGALFTDIILQAGVNYRTVVFPRVQRVLASFPHANNVLGLKECIDQLGTNVFLNWQDSVKINRMNSVVSFVSNHNIEDEYEFGNFLYLEQNRKQFRSISGIGDKTVDYALKLMGFDCVAVDRHIISFIQLAGVHATNYQQVKKIVEFAADLLHVSRSTIDATIWHRMSRKNQNLPCQAELAF